MRMRSCISAKRYLLWERKKMLLLLILAVWPFISKILNSGRDTEPASLYSIARALSGFNTLVLTL